MITHVAFFTANEEGDAETVRLALIQPGIAINAPARIQMHTALTLACASGHNEIVTMLLSRGDIDVNAKDNKRELQTALMWACKKGYESIVKLLLAREDVDVDAKYTLEMTVLMGACLQGHEDVVEMLLAREDVNVNAKDKEGKTALIEACY